MVNETAGGVPASGAAAETGPVLALQNVYLKDCSYEAPNGAAHGWELEPADQSRPAHGGHRAVAPS